MQIPPTDVRRGNLLSIEQTDTIDFVNINNASGDVLLGPDQLYSYISQHYGHGSTVSADYYDDADYRKIIDFAEDRMHDSRRADYNIFTNNCTSFAHEAIDAAR